MRESNEQMNSNQNSRAKFKQRVAGGAVLLIVLAIFLPFIFNHSHMGANTPADNTAAQPATTAGQDPAAAQTSAQPQAQNQAADPAAPATQVAATATAPIAQTTAPAADSTQPDQSGLTASQNEPATMSQAQAPAQAQTQAQAPAQTQAQSQAQAPAQAQPQTQAQAQAPAQVQTQPQAQAQPPVQESAPVVTAEPAQPRAHHAALPSPTKTNNLQVTAKGHWLVQVGSFSQPEYADQLVSKLRAHGLHAYAKHESNHMVHVYVGPVASQEQALKIQQQVQEEFQLTSLVKQNRA